MKYFEVRQEYVEGTRYSALVAMDGEPLELPQAVEESVMSEIVYVVDEYAENGMVENVREYKTIEEVIEDHQPDLWQNNNW